MQNDPSAKDASGNAKFGDIGPFLKKQIETHFKEIGREINTTGSKAYDSTIQQCVVLMKDELEKAKEQVLNVL